METAVLHAPASGSTQGYLSPLEGQHYAVPIATSAMTSDHRRRMASAVLANALFFGSTIVISANPSTGATLVTDRSSAVKSRPLRAESLFEGEYPFLNFYDVGSSTQSIKTPGIAEVSHGSTYRVVDWTTELISIRDTPGPSTQAIFVAAQQTAPDAFTKSDEFQSRVKYLMELMPEADPALIKDAATFYSHVMGLRWSPDIWSDEGEITFEWISGSKHAIVTFDGDGRYGYAMLKGETFKGGTSNDPTPDVFPNDLREYLEHA